MIVLLLGLAGWALIELLILRPARNLPVPVVTQQTIYDYCREAIAKGFNPYWVCKDDQEFADTYQRKLNLGLVLAAAPPDVKSLGVAYGFTISRNTVILLVRVRGQPVIVFADRAGAGQPSLPAECGLKLYQRQIDAVMLWELSPLDRPHVLELFLEAPSRPGTQPATRP